ncbi:hypothetical protein SPHINGOAX6_10042 [Sphingomonas sp. AX6]|nr:hypothetical protein SPHINGOAX6_10042 [Sphingomonas sp. AX6]
MLLARVPAQAGTQGNKAQLSPHWAPAFAGARMSERNSHDHLTQAQTTLPQATP